MLGFINRAFECFVRDTYGADTWSRLAAQAGFDFDHFEPMLHYNPALAQDMIRAATQVLDRPRDGILEDLGTYLVSHPNLERLRRLLRFGGQDFEDFLYSLEDLPARGRLALPELDLPRLTVVDQGGGMFRLHCQMPILGAGHVLVGLLRAMADDYGALVLIDFDQTLPNGAELVAVHLLDHRHSSGRRFDLAAQVGAGL
jgi:hypothetical protein